MPFDQATWQHPRESPRHVRGSARIYDIRMAQFVLKIEKLSHIIGVRGSQDLRSPSPIMAPAATLPRVFLLFHGIHTLSECVYQENTSDKWDIPSWYITTERCITMLYHPIENTVTYTTNATYAQRMMGRLEVISSDIQRLSCILIGCIFYGMV